MKVGFQTGKLGIWQIVILQCLITISALMTKTDEEEH
jgi:hypothetical protein